MNIIDDVAAICAALAKRAPDLSIGGTENPYMQRWFLIPRNRVFNIYLHRILRDDDEALHDHPWPNVSIPLDGRYCEIVFAREPQHGAPLPAQVEHVRSPGHVYCRRAKTAHRLKLLRDAEGRPLPCWSLFLTGPRLRSWGFWCPAGRWVHWRAFTAGPNGEVVDRGCGEAA